MSQSTSLCVSVLAGEDLLLGPDWIKVENAKTLIDVLVQVSGTRALGQQVQVVVSREPSFTEAALVQVLNPVSLLNENGSIYVKFLLRSSVLSLKQSIDLKCRAERDTDVSPLDFLQREQGIQESKTEQTVTTSKGTINQPFESNYLNQLFNEHQLSPCMESIKQELTRIHTESEHHHFTTWQQQSRTKIDFDMASKDDSLVSLSINDLTKWTQPGATSLKSDAGSEVVSEVMFDNDLNKSIEQHKVAQKEESDAENAVKSREEKEKQSSCKHVTKQEIETDETKSKKDKNELKQANKAKPIASKRPIPSQVKKPLQKPRTISKQVEKKDAKSGMPAIRSKSTRPLGGKMLGTTTVKREPISVKKTIDKTLKHLPGLSRNADKVKTCSIESKIKEDSSQTVSRKPTASCGVRKVGISPVVKKSIGPKRDNGTGVTNTVTIKKELVTSQRSQLKMEQNKVDKPAKNRPKIAADGSKKAENRTHIEEDIKANDSDVLQPRLQSQQDDSGYDVSVCSFDSLDASSGFAEALKDPGIDFTCGGNELNRSTFVDQVKEKLKPEIDSTTNQISASPIELTGSSSYFDIIQEAAKINAFAEGSNLKHQEEVKGSDTLMLEPPSTAQTVSTKSPVKSPCKDRPRDMAPMLGKSRDMIVRQADVGIERDNEDEALNFPDNDSVTMDIGHNSLFFQNLSEKLSNVGCTFGNDLPTTSSSQNGFYKANLTYSTDLNEPDLCLGPKKSGFFDHLKEINRDTFSLSTTNIGNESFTLQEPIGKIDESFNLEHVFRNALDIANKPEEKTLDVTIDREIQNDKLEIDGSKCLKERIMLLSETARDSSSNRTFVLEDEDEETVIYSSEKAHKKEIPEKDCLNENDRQCGSASLTKDEANQLADSTTSKNSEAVESIADFEYELNENVFCHVRRKWKKQFGIMDQLLLTSLCDLSIELNVIAGQISEKTRKQNLQKIPVCNSEKISKIAFEKLEDNEECAALFRNLRQLEHHLIGTIQAITKDFHVLPEYIYRDQRKRM